jgi:serine/threonine protein kinase
MEERYEIREKIGQGGLGAVYRGYDTRMNREVAIKRISVANDDPALQEESTRQLIKEAGALASLQHPHIVTIYDVGSDADGPYVVMELINGKTLDELIEQAPLTWSDFRELALQTEEALIAAQELDLIHSDLKPSNLMLTWLPSGKFQIKIVDFGLATLTQSQSREELQELEAVFGSIFFMAPEQFERVPIDARTDMYAIGCVYYQALTGIYPFRGETGHEVMVSHLHHCVTPLQEVRSDIPLWACDWIMWHINRLPDDRPESARQALHVFLQNDKNPNPTLSLGRAQPAVPTGPRPKLAIPTAGTFPAPKRRIADPRIAPPGYAPPPEPPAAVIPDPPLTTTAPQPLLPPEGFKPSIHTAPQPIPEVVAATGPLVATRPLQPTARTIPSVRYTIPQKKSNNWLKIGLALVLCVAAGVLGMALRDRIKASQGSQRYDTVMADALKPEVAEIPMTGEELGHFLNLAADADTDAQQASIYPVLLKAKPSDTTDFEGTLANFAVNYVQILPETREAFIRNVVAKRMNAALVPVLVEFARRTNHAPSAVASVQAVAPLAGDDQFEPMLAILQFHPSADLKKAAAETAQAILKRSPDRAKLEAAVSKVASDTTDPKIRELLDRLK